MTTNTGPYLYGEEVGEGYLYIGDGLAVNPKGELLTTLTLSTDPGRYVAEAAMQCRPHDGCEDQEAWEAWATVCRVNIRHRCDDARRVKHTPGPWEVDLDLSSESRSIGYTYDVEAYGAGRHIAAVATQPNGEDSANARLIAAAPDLLAALREILDTVSTGEDARDIVEDVHQLATAAIAKATGDA